MPITDLLPSSHIVRDIVQRGKVLAPLPVLPTDPLYVALPNYSLTHHFQVPGGQWSSVAPPPLDSTVLVIFDDEGDAWAFDSGLADRAVVTALPSSPYDGQEVSYQSAAMAAIGRVWRFKYRAASASTYKWEFIGGMALRDYVATSGGRSNGAYGSLSAGATGPALTAPLEGDYAVEWGANIEIPGMNNGWRGRMSPNSTDADAIWAAGVGNTAGDRAEGASCAGDTSLTLTAGQTLTCQYRSDNALLVNFAERWMTLLPVRVKAT